MSDPNPRTVVAAHEAGHCLLYRAFGRSVAGVTIERNGELAGQVWAVDPASNTLEQVRGEVDAECACIGRSVIGEAREAVQFDELRKAIIICAGGWCAERIAFGKVCSNRAAGADLHCARQYAGVLALTDEGAEALLEYAEREGAAILRRYWRSTQQIAAALLERGTLNAEQIDAAIAHGVALSNLDGERVRRERWRAVEAGAARFDSNWVN